MREIPRSTNCSYNLERESDGADTTRRLTPLSPAPKVGDQHQLLALMNKIESMAPRDASFAEEAKCERGCPLQNYGPLVLPNSRSTEDAAKIGCAPTHSCSFPHTLGLVVRSSVYGCTYQGRPWMKLVQAVDGISPAMMAPQRSPRNPGPELGLGASTVAARRGSATRNIRHAAPVNARACAALGVSALVSVKRML